jgi:hypothetical protein
MSWSNLMVIYNLQTWQLWSRKLLSIGFSIRCPPDDACVWALVDRPLKYHRPSMRCMESYWPASDTEDGDSFSENRIARQNTPPVRSTNLLQRGDAGAFPSPLAKVGGSTCRGARFRSANRYRSAAGAGSGPVVVLFKPTSTPSCLWRSFFLNPRLPHSGC